MSSPTTSIPPSGEPARQPSRLKRWLQNLVLMAATFLLCFLVLEVALRIAGFGNIEIYQADPLVYWRLKPNQDCFTKVDHKPVHVNSHGTRGPEFQPAKPANTIRILSLGDSKTFGWGLTEAESYSGLIEKMLQQQAGAGRRVEVINAGVNAWSYAQMHTYLREFGLKFQPDVVILADANLWTQFSDQNSPEFVKAFMRRVWLKNLLRRSATYHYIMEYKLQEVYAKHRTKFVPMDPKQDTFFKAQQAADPDAFFRNHIEGICSLARSNHIKPLLLHMPIMGQLRNPEGNNVLKAKELVSRKLGVPLVDMTADMKPLGTNLFLEADEAHLNVRGNQMVAQRLFTSLTNLLQSQP
jgi:lysophospholipase L1-like esterase